ncbi:MAG: ATP-binding protein [Oscillospiraceae bacterium]|nr:ATP-binding protein [Oscillospiraceae bacterium]
MKKSRTPSRFTPSRSTVISLIITLFVFFAIIVVQTLSVIDMAYEKNSQERFDLIYNANRFIYGSSYLTTEVRYYVVTGDIAHYDNFWREVNETRSRDAAINAMFELGLTDEEAAIVIAMQFLSDGLIITENEAMELTRAGEYDKARELVFGYAYERVVERIREHHENFLNALKERTQINVEQIRRRQALYSRLALGLIIVIGVLQLFNIALIKKSTIAPLRKASEQFRVMLDSAPLSVSLFDKNFDCFTCNKESQRVFGSEVLAHDNMNETFPEFQPNGRNSLEIFNELMSKAFSTGVSSAEMVCKRYDGSLFPCEITYVRAVFNGEDVVAEYVIDLTNAKNAMTREHEAKAALEVAEQENTAKTRFLAHMSHEIRTPINAVSGISDAQLQKDELPEETREAFARIKASSNMLCAIVNDILDLSKIEAGKMQIFTEEYDTASMIVDVVRLNTVQGEARGNKFELSVSENLPAAMVGDEVRLKQVINNLLSNAFKYTDGGVITAAFDFDTDDGTLVITVSDTGRGMTRGQLERLFKQDFTRFNAKKQDGVGLGMMITHSLVSLMEGTIDVQSEYKRGTTISVTLPQESPRSETIGRNTAYNLSNFCFSDEAIQVVGSRIEYASMPHAKVLIVDDVSTNIYVAAELLKPYSLQIETALSGREAIAKVTEGGVYNIIFMDHMMPEMDGIEAMQAIRSLGYSAPIIALTANAVAGTRERLLRSGFDEFITKPIDIHALDALLKRFITPAPPATPAIPAGGSRAKAIREARAFQPPVS